MDEIVKSIKAFLYDRTVSPLFGAYVAAWFVWNHEIPIVLLDSKALLTEKFAFLDAHFANVTFQIGKYPIEVWGWLVQSVLWPASLTLIYIYVYPKLAKPVYKHSLEKQIELKKIKQQEEESRLLTVEESRYLIKEIEQLRLKADTDAEQYRARVNNLTETINDLESKLKEAQHDAPNSKEIKESFNQTQEDEFDSDDLYKLAKNKLGKLKEGEFGLSDLFDKQDWEKLGAHKRYLSEGYFAELVESGEFSGVFMSRKGPDNRIIYRKGLSTKLVNQSAIKEELERYLPVDHDSDELVNKVIQYCIANNISEEMIVILFELVLKDGSQHIDLLKSDLRTKLSKIELEHILKKMVDHQLINLNGVNVGLSIQGKEMAVTSGLTSLAKRAR